MDPNDNLRATAAEIVSDGTCRGLHVAALLKDSSFEREGRWIFFWRKDSQPWSGRADEPQGTLRYNMQGRIKVLPAKFSGSESAFRGMWSEAGVLDSVDDAVDLLKAWLLDTKEVDDLPRRTVRRGGI